MFVLKVLAAVVLVFACADARWFEDVPGQQQSSNWFDFGPPQDIESQVNLDFQQFFDSIAEGLNWFKDSVLSIFQDAANDKDSTIIIFTNEPGLTGDVSNETVVEGGGSLITPSPDIVKLPEDDAEDVETIGANEYEYKPLPEFPKLDDLSLSLNTI